MTSGLYINHAQIVGLWHWVSHIAVIVLITSNTVDGRNLAPPKGWLKPYKWWAVYHRSTVAALQIRPWRPGFFTKWTVPRADFASFDQYESHLSIVECWWVPQVKGSHLRSQLVCKIPIRKNEISRYPNFVACIPFHHLTKFSRKQWRSSHESSLQWSFSNVYIKDRKVMS